MVADPLELSTDGPLSKGLRELNRAINDAARFGTEISENMARLYGHVPYLGPLAYLHIVFPPLDGSGIAKLAKILNRPVPDPYQQLLLVTNGLYLFSGALSLYGLRTDYSRRLSIVEPFHLADPNVSERPKAAKPSWFIFGFYKSDGSSAYMDPMTGHVYRANRDMTEPHLNDWASLDTFLESEIKRLRTHFDDRGHRLDPSRSTAPEQAN